MKELIQAIVYHPVESDFSDLMRSNYELVQGFKVVYSTNNRNMKFGGISLLEIEQECPTIKKYFYGSDLMFYSDTIFDEALSEGNSVITTECVISIDSNVAEKIRIWANGGNLGQEAEKLESLIRFLKLDSDNSRGIDYSFFILENLRHSLQCGNDRPLNTLKALKKLERLDFDSASFDIEKPVFLARGKSENQEAREIIKYYQSSGEVSRFQQRQSCLYAILLKAVILNQKPDIGIQEHLLNLVLFSMEVTGKFAKTEIYFGWKLLKYSNSLRFFGPIKCDASVLIQKIRGMAWDLFSYRHLESLTSKMDMADFYIPLFASFDNRFMELSKVCPVRSVVLDPHNQQMVTVFVDELEFQTELSAAMHLKQHRDEFSVDKQLGRSSNSNLDVDKLSNTILILEKELIDNLEKK